jgi:serine/threonine-protein kinase
MSQGNPFFGTYEILAELGRGTTGIVLKARADMPINRVRALKVLLLAPAADASLRVARFHREAEVLANLTGDPDPDFPTLYEAGEHNGQFYLVREFVEGNTLEYQARAGLLSLREGIAILASVGGAVRRVHDRGIAHRNLHPSNVLIAADGTPKLSGFGLVGLLEGSERLPPGSPGTPAAVDVQALQRMLGWLCSALNQPKPAWLQAIEQDESLRTPAAFVEALARAGSW